MATPSDLGLQNHSGVFFLVRDALRQARVANIKTKSYWIPGRTDETSTMTSPKLPLEGRRKTAQLLVGIHVGDLDKVAAEMKETRAEVEALLAEDIARVRAAAAEMNNDLKNIAARVKLSSSSVRGLLAVGKTELSADELAAKRRAKAFMDS